MRQETLDFLSDLIRFPSVPGAEQPALEWLARRLRPLCDEVTLVPIPADIAQDPEYSSPIPGLRAEGRTNLRAVVGGDPAAAPASPGAGRSLIVNAHVDVVPASEGQQDAFDPGVRDGALHGRGACDDKGQIAALYEALLRLREKGLRPAGRLILHIVGEEENGGNGTLALMRGGDRADAAVVLEPTDLAVAHASRSSVWFTVRTRGEPAHVGGSAGRRSALAGAIAAMAAIERRHAALRERSRGVPPFEALDNAMPLTFGTLHAGTWPASVPGEAVLQGVFAFLPNFDRGIIMEEIRQSLRGEPGLEDAEVVFPYRHECHVTALDAPIVRAALQACAAAGFAGRATCFPASSDAWQYAHLLGIPTVLFGAGRLQDAHSLRENVSLRDVDSAATMLEHLISKWCRKETERD